MRKVNPSYLIFRFIDWNEKKITADEFCSLFHKVFKKEISEEIRKRIQEDFQNRVNHNKRKRKSQFHTPGICQFCKSKAIDETYVICKKCWDMKFEVTGRNGEKE